MPSETGMSEIGLSCRVIMHFSLTLEDGTVAESSFDNEPLDFVMGDGTLVRGLELALLGLKPGERQQILLTPDQGWGQRDEAQIHILGRDRFPEDMMLEPGVIIGFTGEEGQEIPGLVLEAGEDTVKVDFNHPLAGHAIRYDVEILDVIPGGQAGE
jgi:FKBP-type peptidyl-prolyl cis-trans isomerase SlpA